VHRLVPVFTKVDDRKSSKTERYARVAIDPLTAVIWAAMHEALAHAVQNPHNFI
jgi:hypothetical protein